DATFYYYTGAGRLIGAVLVLDGATRRAEMFLPSARPGTYVGMSQADLGADRAASLRVDAVSEWRALAPFIERRLADYPRLTIHVDDGGAEAASAGRLASPLDSLAVPGNPQVAWHRSLQRRWPNAVIVTDTAITATLRAVKDSSEIAVLRRVAENSVAAFFAGLPRFGPGQRQRPVEAAVVEACTRLGDGPSFWPWVMTGPNAVFPVPFSSALDQHNLDRAMRAGEVARFDLGCKVDHYKGDVGRTLPVTGTFTPEQREVIDVMVAMYRAGLAVLRDGVEVEALLRAGVAEARRLQRSMRTPLGKRAAALLMQPDSLPYWQTHGVGLDHAEPLPSVLRAGMVLAYEPIFTVGTQGFYMEDMILVTPTGYEILTEGLPTTAGEIERAMRRRQP
ncbi:MAG: Xaa-Pro aminopeptidase, partial [Geminicoccaceae bacterium]|nr:Xaa-Pro aminopeptidase [Geminicoccaceae bacterium]